MINIDSLCCAGPGGRRSVDGRYRGGWRAAWHATRWKGGVAAALILAIGAASAAEQDIEYPAGDRPAMVPQNLMPPVVRPLKCMVHTEGAPIFARPLPQSPVVATARFRQGYYVAGFDNSREPKYYFLVTAVNELKYPELPIRDCQGWVRCSDCLLFPRPEEQRHDAPSGPESLCAGGSPIHRKAMLINRLQEGTGVEALTQKVRFLAGPHADSAPLQSYALFNIFYIFAETPTHFLLGREPRIKDWVTDKDDLLGWVPRQRVCQWNTREAVEFNKRDMPRAAGQATTTDPHTAAPGQRDAQRCCRTQPCRIYQELDQLKAYVDTANVDRVPPFAEEDPAVGEWRFDQPRFPLIDVDSGASVVPYKGNTLYRVGFIGDVFRQSAGTNKVERVATSAQIDQLHSRVRSVQERLAKIQLCFIIDGTFSMDPWVKAAANAVNAIVSGLNDRIGQGPQGQSTIAAHGAQSIEISVNFYRNVRDQPKDIEFHPFQRPSEARELLDNAEPFGGGDYHEQVFAAICRRLQAKDSASDPVQTGQPSVSRMAFEPNAIKIVVLIGDDGNDPNDAAYGTNEVCKQIQALAGPSPVAFLAFPVGTGQRRELFVTQMKQIAQRLAQAESAAFSVKRTLDADIKARLEAMTAQVAVSSDAAQIVEGIYARVALALTEKDYLQKSLEYLYAGAQIPDDLLRDTDFSAAGEKDAAAARRAFGVIWKKRMEDLIHKQKLETLELARHGVQLFQEGWIAETDPQETASPDQITPSTIRHVVLMHKSEVRRLADFLQLVVNEYETRPLQRVWKEGLASVAGEVEVNSQMTLQQLMGLYFGIKVHTKNSLLALSFEDLGRLEPGRILQLRNILTESFDRLNDALQDQEAEYRWDPVGNTGRRTLRRLNPQPRRYWWFGEGREDAQKEARAWIDRDSLP